MYYSEFLKRRIKQSLLDTWVFLQRRLLVPISLAVITPAISLAITWFTRGSIGQFSFYSFLSLGAFVVFVFIVYLVYYIKAPVTVITQLEQVASAALIDKKKLEELQRPKLKIHFQKGQEPYEHRDPSVDPDGRGQRIFRIAVENDSTAFLSRCTVKLQEMTPNRSPDLPVTLKQRHDNPPINTCDANSMDYKQTFALSPHDKEYIDVAQLNEMNPNSQIQLCYARQKGHP